MSHGAKINPASMIRRWFVTACGDIVEGYEVGTDRGEMLLVGRIPHAEVDAPYPVLEIQCQGFAARNSEVEGEPRRLVLDGPTARNLGTAIHLLLGAEVSGANGSEWMHWAIDIAAMLHVDVDPDIINVETLRENIRLAVQARREH